MKIRTLIPPLLLIFVFIAVFWTVKIATWYPLYDTLSHSRTYNEGFKEELAKIKTIHTPSIIIKIGEVNKAFLLFITYISL